ncbi:ABC transporter substrate-binding protein [Brucella endophytica]|uniref:ABC transporter substrate-binding protein n=1 Tax=Brucella endophytica TaxID=1963359 RepID=UPI001664152C|nr:ABC transporter substrate-binding protein [Brucella endophytica]
MRGSVTRRAALAGLIAAPCFLAGGQRASAALAFRPRVAALDWGLAESLVALDVTPVALPEINNYRRLVDARLPETVLDIGLRIEPNFEAIQRSAPDLIVVNPGYVAFAEKLGRVAPVKSYAVFDANDTPFDNASRVLTELGRATGRETEAKAYLGQAEATLKGLAGVSGRMRGRPVYLVTIIDERHVMVHGSNSLFQHPLQAAGLRNAWDRPGNLWGYANIGFDGINGEAEALVINLGPIPPRVAQGLADSQLWNSLPFVRAGRFHAIPALWTFGGLPSAMRFTAALTEIIRTIGQ